MLDPPDDNRYDALKVRLLSHFSDSEQSRLKKLLGDLELGTKRPSHLLREMKTLSGKTMNDDLLKSLWLQRLPSSVQAILAITSESLDNLAIMADKICEIPSTSEISQVKIHPTSMENQISELSKRIESLNAKIDRQNTNKSHVRYRSRSRTPARSSARKQSPSGSGCWYHKRFGDRATKCTKPCTYKPNTTPENH